NFEKKKDIVVSILFSKACYESAPYTCHIARAHECEFNAYCKRLNFREDLIFANFANRLRFAKNRSRKQFGQYVNATEGTFDSRKLKPANNFKFSALARFAKI
ncbi:MAG: hypothetical protein PV344_03475, partial [Anaplasma sp.]|nr:hypothetical protein [Anaplasma sp.]